MKRPRTIGMGSERLGFGVLALCAGAIVSLVGCVVAVLIWEGAEVAVSWSFLTSEPRKGMTEGGILPAIVGTVYVTLVTAVLSVPVGVLAAVYLHDYAKPNLMTRLVRLSIRNLAGVPSIVYGLFGVALFVHGLGFGMSVLASGCTLGLLTLPWTISASEEALATVPQTLRDGAMALGATRAEALVTVVLPGAAPGILTGVILGLARAAGETAPILFTGVAFATPGLPVSPLDRFMALPYHLYVLSTQHHDPDMVRPLAYATALVLLGVVMGLGGLTAALRGRVQAPLKRS